VGAVAGALAGKVTVEVCNTKKLRRRSQGAAQGVNQTKV